MASSMSKLLTQAVGFLFVAALLLSCQSAKDIKRQTDVLRRPNALISASEARGLHFEGMSIKASVSITEGNKRTSFKAIIRIKNDSMIWSTITFLGIAGAKVMLDRDSFKLVNYRDRNYISESYKTVQDMFKSNLLTMRNLQDILLAELPQLEEFEKLKLKLEDDRYHLTTLSERKLENDWLEKKMDKLERKIEKQEKQNDEKGLERKERKQEKAEEKYENMALEIWMNPFNLKVENLNIKDYYYDAEINIAYADFKEISDSTHIPHKVSIVMSQKTKKKIDIEYTKVELDRDPAMPFNIPNSYKRVQL